MRNVESRWPMIFGFRQPYSPDLQKLTGLAYHCGQDFACQKGTTVLAGVDGVLLSAEVHRGYGYMVEILFRDGLPLIGQYYILRLAHLLPNSCKIKPGMSVRKTDPVALSGASGNATYADGSEHPHLHVELWKAKKVAGGWARTELVSPALVTRVELPKTIPG